MTRRFAATIAGVDDLTWDDFDPDFTWNDFADVTTWNDLQQAHEIGTPQIVKRIGEQATCRFVLLDPETRFDIDKGLSVAVWLERDDDLALLYRGLIDEPSLTPWASQGALWDISLHGLNVLAERRVVAEAYEDVDVDQIVSDLVDRYLSADGVTANIAPEAQQTTIRAAIFNYIYLDQALDKIAERAGMWWRIDDDRVLQFHLQTSRPAPFDIAADGEDGAISYVSEFSRAKTGPDYRNRQLIRGVRDLTDPQTERFRGDGDTQSFTVGFPIARQPTIKVNDVEQTVGVRGIDDDAGRDWYWSKGSHTFTQDSEASELTDTDVLEITYRGHIDMVVRLDNNDEIQARAATESTSGIWEHLLDEPDVEGRLDAFQLAAAKLAKYAEIGHAVTYRTHREGLEPGQLQHVDVPAYGIDEEVLIEQVELDVRGVSVGWRIEAIRGPVSESWKKLFARLYELPKRSLVFRENIAEDETLTLLFDFEYEWDDDDHPVNIYREVYPRAGLFPSADLFPAFAVADRVLFLEVYNTSDTLLERIQITLTDQQQDDELFTSVLIQGVQAIGDVGEIAWFGGYRATPTPGSGVEIGRDVIGETKTEEEAWQVDRFDTRADEPEDWWIA